MRALSFVLFVVVLAVAGWLFLADDSGPSLPTAPTPTVKEPGKSAELATGSQPDRSDQTPAAPKATTPPTETKPAAPGEPTLPANVLLRANDVTTRQPLPAFRWRFRSGTVDVKGEGLDGKADLTLPSDNLGVLLVECEGYEPHTHKDLMPPGAPSPATTIDLFLAPADRQAGITLYVRDPQTQPVPHLRVDAFAITETNRDSAFWLGPSLWARRASSPGGSYKLPDLQPGEYGIRAVAVDENGEVLPLLPYTRIFALTGSNGFLEDVPLEPGALLALELLDNTNQSFDPAKYGVTTLSLRLPNGPAVQRTWLVTSQGVAASAVDAVPGTGLVRLAEAIPAGQYQLEVFVQGDPRDQRQLLLRPGMQNVERVLVR